MDAGKNQAYVRLWWMRLQLLSGAVHHACGRFDSPHFGARRVERKINTGPGANFKDFPLHWSKELFAVPGKDSVLKLAHKGIISHCEKPGIPVIGPAGRAVRTHTSCTVRKPTWKLRRVLLFAPPLFPGFFEKVALEKRF